MGRGEEDGVRDWRRKRKNSLMSCLGESESEEVGYRGRGRQKDTAKK